MDRPVAERTQWSRVTWERAEDGALIHGNGVVVRVSWEDVGIARIGARRSTDGAPQFLDGPMLDPNRSRGGARFSTHESTDELVLHDESLAVHIDLSTGSFSYRNGHGELLFAEPEQDGKQLAPRQDASGYRTRLGFTFSEGEALYGLGQHEEGRLDRRGQHLELYQHNLKVAVPFLVSSRGWGLLWHGYSAMTFHDNASDAQLLADCVDEMDYFVLAAGSLNDVIRCYRGLTGAAPIPPRWAFGFVQSRERYENQEQLLQTARRYAELGLPAECIVQDWQYWPEGQWGQKSFDPQRFPDPEGMCREVHALGTKIMVSVWPHLDATGADHAELKAAGKLLDNDRTYNAFDPEARRLFWEQTRRGLLSHGFDALWCDCSEPFEADWYGANEPTADQRRRINVQTAENYLGARMSNAYSLAHARGVWEGHRSSGSTTRILNLTRSAYAGQQRYGSFTWSGDISASWDTLARQIPEGLNFAASGLPYWTCDVGGFFVKPGDAWFARGEFPDGVGDPGYRELFLRWFQYGTFQPMLRAHGTDTPREIWHFGEPGDDVYDTLVQFIKLRKALVPYLYAIAGAVYHDGASMMRPLAFDFSHDPRALRVDDQFLLGPCLMVCPVTRPQQFGPDSPRPHDATRLLYLPQGSTWIDVWDGTARPGGTRLDAPTPLRTIPVYAKAGSILPLARPDGDLELVIFPAADGAFDLYEDEGDGWGYEAGQHSLTTLRWNDADRTLIIGQTQGAYPGMPTTRTIHVKPVQPGRGWQSSTTDSVTVTHHGEELSVRIL